jgi:Predicted transcriptional regulators
MDITLEGERMIIALDMTKDTPIYEQLKQQIVAGIARGRLQPGEPMPSVRQLSAELSINLHTVAKAYNQLRDEGFLTVRRSRGVVVNPVKKFQADEAYIASLIGALALHALTARSRGVSRERWLKLCGKAYDQ